MADTRLERALEITQKQIESLRKEMERLRTLAGSSLGSGAWDSGHLVLGNHHLWVDSSGTLRSKNSAPESDTDGSALRVQTPEIQAWSSAIGAHLMIPGLRCFWPMSVKPNSFSVNDLSGNDISLTINGTVSLRNEGLVPAARFFGSGYLQKADDSIFDSTGIVLGGWFYFDSAASSQTTLMSKRGTGTGQISFQLYRTTNGRPSVLISKDGTNSVATNATNPVTTGWYHIVASHRATDGTLQIYVDGVRKAVNVGANYTIFSSTAPFQINGFNGSNGLFSGAASLCFFAGSESTTVDNQTLIQSLYESTRALFGK